MESFKKIYSEAIKYWPNKIDISDVELTGNDGAYFKTLSETWSIIEDKTEPESEFIQLMVWAIFCGIHKKAKNILIYLLALIIGIVFTITIYKLEKSGGKSRFEYFVHSNLYVGPDSLINHFPEYELLIDAIFSSIKAQDKKEIGGGYADVTILKSDSLDQFVKTLKIKEEYLKINKKEIFNVDLNYSKSRYDVTNYTDSTLYPFPDYINKNNFDNFKLLFYDYGKGVFINDEKLRENKHIKSGWKHGYTRGIVENKQGEYKMWLILW